MRFCNKFEMIWTHLNWQKVITYCFAVLTTLSLLFFQEVMRVQNTYKFKTDRCAHVTSPLLCDFCVDLHTVKKFQYDFHIAPNMISSIGRNIFMLKLSFPWYVIDFYCLSSVMSSCAYPGFLGILFCGFQSSCLSVL